MIVSLYVLVVEVGFWVGFLIFYYLCGIFRYVFRMDFFWCLVGFIVYFYCGFCEYFSFVLVVVVCELLNCIIFGDFLICVLILWMYVINWFLYIYYGEFIDYYYLYDCYCCYFNLMRFKFWLMCDYFCVRFWGKSIVCVIFVVVVLNFVKFLFEGCEWMDF